MLRVVLIILPNAAREGKIESTRVCSVPKRAQSGIPQIVHIFQKHSSTSSDHLPMTIPLLQTRKFVRGADGCPRLIDSDPVQNYSLEALHHVRCSVAAASKLLLELSRRQSPPACPEDTGQCGQQRPSHYLGNDAVCHRCSGKVQ